MVLRTKSIYQPREKDDGLRVLITRFYPRGVKKDRFDEWVRALSPSRELLFSYRRGRIDWDGFTAAFIGELSDNPEALETIWALRQASKTKNVTLLCYEKEGAPCHRHIVRELIERSVSASLDPGAAGSLGRPSPGRT